MSGRSIPAISGRSRDFQELGHHPLFDPYGRSWNCHGTCVSVMVVCVSVCQCVSVCVSVCGESWRYLGVGDGVQGLGLQLLGDVGDGVGHHHGPPVEHVLHCLHRK